MTWLADFHVALTFLTRFGRARISSDETILRSVWLYPLVGAVIGVVMTTCACIPLASWPLAWILTGLNIFMTRGLHWDGWADLWDAWGSGATGQRFWDIMKDSHVGAFGVMGLVLGLGMHATLLQAAIDTKAWSGIFFAPVFGRFCCLVLARLGRHHARPGLGQSVLIGATPRTLCAGALTTLIAAVRVSFAHVAIAAAFSMVPLALLCHMAKNRGGLNGDFLGASIIAGELSILLALVI